MDKTASLILVSLLRIGILPLLGAPATDQELAKNVTLTEYTCEFSFIDIPVVYVNYKIKNVNPITLYGATLNYHVEYQNRIGTVTPKEGEGEGTVKLLGTSTIQDRVQVVILPTAVQNRTGL
jgi:hypothetical protein